MESEEERCGRTIVRLAHRMVVRRDADLSEIGITDSQAETLHIIRGHPGIDVTSLGRISGTSHQTCGGIVRRLADKGLVVIRDSARDGRSRELALSEEGLRVEGAIDSFRGRTGSLLLSGMDKDERTAFLSLLDRALANIDTEEDRGGEGRA